MGHVKDRWYAGKGENRRPSTRHGAGMRWQVWYQVDGREKCGGSFAVKAVAERKLIELESSVIRGQWVDPTDQTTVTDWVRQYAASRPSLRHKSAYRYESMIKIHIEPFPIGARRIGKVRPSEAQAWITDRAVVLAPSTLQMVVGLVRAAFRAAEHDHLVASNPFAPGRVRVPRIERERVVPLTVDQVADLADAIGPRYRALVLTQAGLGLRIGELLGLRPADVDFLRRTVTISQQLDVRTRELAPLKTKQSRRTLPLPQVASVALAEHMRLHRPNPDGLLFQGTTGQPMWVDRYGSRVFARAVAEAKLPVGTVPHSLRHFYASVLLAAGESVVAVAERLGHENATLVLATYGHLLPDREDHTRRAIDDAWATRTAAPEELVTAPGRPG